MSAGFTAAQIRELVHEYNALPHGSKGVWLRERGLKPTRLLQWTATVFAGDLERGLVPRKAGQMTVPPSARSAFERARAAERSTQEAELARAKARIAELEATNDALGKAIGLLHAMNEHGPDANQTPTEPPSS